MWSEGRQRWVGRISAGYRPDGKRRVITVTAKTKTEALRLVRIRVGEVENGDLAAGVMTVREAASDWLRHGMPNRAPATVQNRSDLVNTHLIPQIGARRLEDLTATDVDEWLLERSPVLARSTLVRLLSVLGQILRRAMGRGFVRRDVSVLCQAPASKRPGRPSKSLTLKQATKLLEAADEVPPMDAYMSLSILTGARTEELRAMVWGDVDLDSDVASVSLVRSVRAGGDTKTQKSRRRLELADHCVTRLRRHAAREASKPKPGDLVFTTARGTAWDAANVRRSFRRVVERAGLEKDAWTPRELRHSFVSLMSEAGVSVEEIAHLVGHSNTTTTERVYRKELRPVLRRGAITMNGLFDQSKAG